jgi:hypothetical protein
LDRPRWHDTYRKVRTQRVAQVRLRILAA